MATQTYMIRAGGISSACDVVIAGNAMSQAIYLGKDNINFDDMWLPDDVKTAIAEHFDMLFSQTLEWRVMEYPIHYKRRIIKTIPHRAAKNKPGTMVDIKRPSGWVSGYFVQDITKASDRRYRIDVKSAFGNDSLYGLAPECVRVSARVS